MTADKELPRAVVLHFPNKRGRPRSIHPKTDLGTPELVMKRALGETSETLDLCYEKGLITKEQHWCGVHLRWLYTLRYGAPGVRAVDPTHLGGMDIKSDDPLWRSSRENEYNEALKLLSHSGHTLMLLNICVFNERPKFLQHGKKTAAKAKKMQTILDNLHAGLDILTAHWCKH
jgi:hypothetical protein